MIEQYSPSILLLDNNLSLASNHLQVEGLGMRIKWCTYVGFLLVIIIGTYACIYGQVENYPQPPHLVNTPTAGSLVRGSYLTEIRMMPEGGVLGSISVGLTDRFLLGVSYGGTHIIGDDSVSWNPEPGVQIKLRLLDETVKFPALAFGFNSQGYHEFIQSENRYEIKSTGFYLVLSKNWQFLGNLGFHGGINYSLERGDGNRNPNLFAGIDKNIGKDIAILLEYDAAFNDGAINITSQQAKKGFLNAAVRWTFSQRFHVEFEVNNLLKNDDTGRVLPSREIKIAYVEFF